MGEFLTTEEAAERLGISERILRQWIKQGRARAARRAGNFWLRPREVERLLKDAQEEPEEPKLRPAVKPPSSFQLYKSPEQEGARERLAELESELHKTREMEAQVTALKGQVRGLQHRLQKEVELRFQLEDRVIGDGSAVSTLERKLREMEARLEEEQRRRFEVEAQLSQPAAEVPPELPSEGETVDTAELEHRLGEVTAGLTEKNRLVERLKQALEETEGELRRSAEMRNSYQARTERLEEALRAAESRNTALEREIQALSDDLEEAERARENEARHLREQMHRGGSPGRDAQAESELRRRVADLEAEMREKDQLIQTEYQSKASLLSRYESLEREHYELSNRYEKEKSEWSEILAREIQNRDRMIQESYNPAPTPKSTPKGWGLFRSKSEP